jgi:glycosyltransferase involved in cell wall biosynthesis
MSSAVIIPAHNESAVIERCLAPWREAIESGEIEVIIVANGCCDDTAERARGFSQKVRVIETPVGSKTHALNLGDEAVSSGQEERAEGRGQGSEKRAEGGGQSSGGVGTRIYVDADVVLDLDSLRRLIAAVGDGALQKLAGAPRAELELSQSSWGVRAYYWIDRRLPWFAEGIGNAGVYAVSAKGRRRWEKFPAITTDDGFVRLHFAPDERVTVSDAVSVVAAPRTLRSLVAIKTRSHYSKWELKRVCPELLGNDGVRNRPVLMRLARDPRNWAALGVYGYVKIAARLRCRLRYRDHDAVKWERDESTRTAAAGAGRTEGAGAGAGAADAGKANSAASGERARDANSAVKIGSVG